MAQKFRQIPIYENPVFGNPDSTKYGDVYRGVDPQSLIGGKTPNYISTNDVWHGIGAGGYFPPYQPLTYGKQAIDEPENVQNVSHNFNYETEVDELDRRQKMAEILQAQAYQPIDTFSYKGIPAPISPLSGLAKILSSYTAGKQQKDVLRERKELRKQNQSNLMDDINLIHTDQFKTTQGTPAQLANELLQQNAVAATEGSQTLIPKEKLLSQMKTPQGLEMLVRILQDEKEYERERRNKSPFALIDRSKVTSQSLLNARNSDGTINLDLLEFITDPPKERKTAVDKFGNLRFIDGNQERVFPEALIGEDSSKERKTAVDKFGNLRFIDGNQERVFPEALIGEDSTAKEVDEVRKLQTQETNQLRKELSDLQKPFITVRDAYGRILASGKDASAAGDLALIFNFMKILDPGSTVREGEFATAAASGGIGERLRAQYNRVIEGERLSEVQRFDFLQRGKMLYEAQLVSSEKTNTFYRNVAINNGLDPDLIVPDLRYPLPEEQNKQRSKLEEQNKQPSKKAVPADGTIATLKGIDYQWNRKKQKWILIEKKKIIEEEMLLQPQTNGAVQQQTNGAVFPLNANEINIDPIGIDSSAIKDEDFTITKKFGDKRLGSELSHEGIFIASRPNNQVNVIQDGKVVYADYLRGFGNLIIVEHGKDKNVFYTLYGNLAETSVVEGDEIRAGMLLGIVGNSGGYETDGVYFEYRQGNKPYDPVEQFGENLFAIISGN